MELEPTKKPLYSYFIGWKDGTGKVLTHAEMFNKGSKEFEEFNNWDTWTEVKPTIENLRELQAFCNNLAEELGVGFSTGCAHQRITSCKCDGYKHSVCEDCGKHME